MAQSRFRPPDTTQLDGRVASASGGVNWLLRVVGQLLEHGVWLSRVVGLRSQQKVGPVGEHLFDLFVRQSRPVSRVDERVSAAVQSHLAVDL